MTATNRLFSLSTLSVLVVGLILGASTYHLLQDSYYPSEQKQEEAPVKSIDSLTKLQQDCYLGTNKEPLIAFDDRKVFLDKLHPKVQNQYLRLLSGGFAREHAYLKELALRIHLHGSDIEEIPSIEALVAEEVEVTDTEVEAYYKENKASFPASMSEEQLKGTLRNHLVTTKKREYAGRVMVTKWRDDSLNLAQAFQCPPAAGHLGATTGEDTPSVRMTIFTDYFCPECRAQWPSLDRWFRAHRDQLAFATIPLVNEQNPTSKYLAAATHCAAKEGSAKHLEFMRNSFRIPLQLESQPDRVEEHVRTQVIPAMQSDLQKFDTCIATFDAEEFVNQAETNSSGWNRTDMPIFLINNRLAQNSREQPITELLSNLLLHRVGPVGKN